jgi:hypothetical protein
MQEDKFQDNKAMVNFNLNFLNVRCILFWKEQLYANVVDYTLVCIDVMYIAF